MDNTNALIVALAAITVTTSAAATEINFISTKASRAKPVNAAPSCKHSIQLDTLSRSI
jgi:hypothetical protein